MMTGGVATVVAIMTAAVATGGTAAGLVGKGSYTGTEGLSIG